MYDEDLMGRIRRRIAAMPQTDILCDQLLKLDGVSHSDLVEHAKLLIDLGEIDARIVGENERRTVFVRKLTHDGWANLLNLRSPELTASAGLKAKANQRATRDC
ncbi:MAG: hypothetical protein WA979_12635 [Pacificimonas sp.]